MIDADNRTSLPRRKTPRHMASFQALVEAEDGDHVCTVVNISREGAMVKGMIGNASGSFIVIDIPKIGRMRALVAWNDGETFGISFDFSPQTGQQVHKSVEETVRNLPPAGDRRQR